MGRLSSQGVRCVDGDWAQHRDVHIDPSVAHDARVHDYLLGGADNFAVDRAAAQAHGRAMGGIGQWRHAAWANRQFLSRAVRYLAAEARVHQFLDLGAGIPTTGSVHDVAQSVIPSARVVYVDHDPLSLAHAHQLPASAPGGSASCVWGDLREPETVLGEAAHTLDLDRPVAVLLVSVLHLVADEDDPYGVVRRYLDALCAGSYLVLSHLASDLEPDSVAALVRSSDRGDDIGYRFHPRGRSQASAFFDQLDLVDPGVVPVERWNPGGLTARGLPTGRGEAPFHAGVGRKPEAPTSRA